MSILVLACAQGYTTSLALRLAPFGALRLPLQGITQQKHKKMPQL